MLALCLIVRETCSLKCWYQSNTGNVHFFSWLWKSSQPEQALIWSVLCVPFYGDVVGSCIQAINRMKHLRLTKVKGSSWALMSFVCLCAFIAVLELFLWCYFYHWFLTPCPQNWIFKVFVIYCGNSDRDFASSIMTLVSHRVRLNSNQPTFGQLCTIYFRVKTLMKKNQFTSLFSWDLIKMLLSHQSSAKFFMSLNPHSFCEDEQYWLWRYMLPNLFTFQEFYMNLSQAVSGAQGLSRPYISNTVLFLVLHIPLTWNMLPYYNYWSPSC